MFDDPAYPSVPPPPREPSIEPMSFLAAVLWAFGAHFLFLSLGVFLTSTIGKLEHDKVVWVMSQMIVYLFTLFFMLRFYAPEARVRDLVGARLSHPAMLLLGLVMGVASSYPAAWSLEKLRGFTDHNEPFQLYTLLEQFFDAAMPERIVIALSFAVIAPLAEELIFRGAIFTTTRKRYSQGQVIAFTSVLFAVIHVDSTTFAVFGTMGALLGYLRWWSGSLLPPLMLHIGFNAVPFVQLFQLSEKPVTETPTSGQEALVGFTIVVMCAGLAHLTGSTRAARAARRADVE
ncbi:MAG: CPBP family intramembrane glutamic endopeptidase [Myxococcota bacterium]